MNNDNQPNPALERAQRGLMPIADQEIFDRITSMSPEALSEYDIAFLKARRTYLTTAQKEDYASVLIDKEEPVEKPSKK